MRSLASIFSGVAIALLLAAGLMALDARPGGLGPSAGAAIAVAAIAAFLLAYDVLKRDGADAAQKKKPASKEDYVKPIFERGEPKEFNGSAHDALGDLDAALEKAERPIVILRLPLAPRVPYEPGGLLNLINRMRLKASDQSWVYVVGRDGGFLYLAKPDAIHDLLNSKNGIAFLGLLNTGHSEQISEFPGFVNFAVKHTDSDASALAKMAGERAPVPLAMIVNDKSKNPIGPIDWPTLAKRILAKES